MTIILDDELIYSPFSNICSLCKNFTRNVSGIPECKAFKIIPIEIWRGQNDHKQPYPGDNNIIFERAESSHA